MMKTYQYFLHTRGEAPIYLERVLPDAVDLVNDLHVTRQQLAHHLDRPLLQGLWHDCVVGECQSLQQQHQQR